MKPRLISSKKWTPFPKDYLQQIELAFAEAFPGQFEENKLILEGRIYPEEILLRVGYLEKGRLKQNNFEVSSPYSPAKKDALDCIHTCVDAAASLMNEFIVSEGEVDFPTSWKDYDFGGMPIWVQYSTVNTELESEADRLLGLQEKNLVVDESAKEDALEFSVERIPSEDDSQEDLTTDSDSDDEDEVDLLKPSLFSGKKKTPKKQDMH